MRSGVLGVWILLASGFPLGAPSADAPETARSDASEAPWKLDESLSEALASRAEAYARYALRFDCRETIRTARYGGDGEADEKNLRTYGYLLVRDPSTESLSELRQKLGKDGKPRGGPVDDEEPFPPAYAWVFLFSQFHQGYFSYQDLGRRFDGFDWVREIRFRGALPFTDGKDIRQWEGTVLVDAVTNTPIEIRAEPSGQADRLQLLYDQWVQAFNLIGFRLAPRPFGYRCHVQFRLQKDGLTFPTELRYDTFRKVSRKENAPWHASIRAYENYRFFRPDVEQTPGSPVER